MYDCNPLTTLHYKHVHFTPPPYMYYTVCPVTVHYDVPPIVSNVCTTVIIHVQVPPGLLVGLLQVT